MEFIFEKGIPDSLEDRWALILKLIDQWFGTKMEVEFNLPHHPATSKGINYWVSFIESMKTGKNKWFIRDSYLIGKNKEVTGFALLIQGEGDRIWAVQNKNIKIEDPPVHCYYLDEETGKFKLSHQASKTLTGFFIKYLFDYMHMFIGKGFTAKINDDKQEVLPFLKCFDVAVKFEGCIIMESPEMIVYYSKSSDIVNVRCTKALLNFEKENPKIELALNAWQTKAFAFQY